MWAIVVGALLLVLAASVAVFTIAKRRKRKRGPARRDIYPHW